MVVINAPYPSKFKLKKVNYNNQLLELWMYVNAPSDIKYKSQSLKTIFFVIGQTYSNKDLLYLDN